MKRSEMTIEDLALDIYTRLMKLTPDHIVHDTKRAAELCKLHGQLFCDLMIEEAKSTLEMAQGDGNIHPHVEGLAVGNIRIWTEVKKEIIKL